MQDIDTVWRRLDLAGALPIFIAGSALHFAYDWLGQWPPAALFAAVNESVWEHLKIAFWPALLWAFALPLMGRPRGAGYWAARGFGLLVTSIAIVVIFFGYTAVVGRNVLLIDIGTFAVAILMGQAISILCRSTVHRHRWLRNAGLIMLVIQIAAFSTFTYAPPHMKLFQDGRNGLYGLSASGAHPRPAKADIHFTN